MPAHFEPAPLQNQREQIATAPWTSKPAKLWEHHSNECHGEPGQRDGQKWLSFHQLSNQNSSHEEPEATID
jgi:hypothetical protein